MDRRRARLLIAAAATIPLTLAVTPVAAATGTRPVTEGRVEGTLARISTHVNRIVLADRTRFLYDSDDNVRFSHLYDYADEQGNISCDLFDSGGEGNAKAYDRRGIELRVVADLRPPAMGGVSSIDVTADTCDGVVDEDDDLPGAAR